MRHIYAEYIYCVMNERGKKINFIVYIYNMKKSYISLYAVLWCVTLFLSGCGLFGWSGEKPLACIDSTCFELEIADTTEEHATWLMDRAELGTWSGMLFVFDNPGAHQFWMKNTLIPLDIIWMDDVGEVVYVKEYAPPCTKDPCQLFGPEKWVQSKYVLELNANSTRMLGISEWVKVDLVGLDKE